MNMIWSRIRQRQVAEEHRVDDREDRVVGADPQRQDHDGHEGEPAVLDEQADRESNVPEQVHGWSPGRSSGRLDATGGKTDLRVLNHGHRVARAVCIGPRNMGRCCPIPAGTRPP